MNISNILEHMFWEQKWNLYFVVYQIQFHNVILISEKAWLNHWRNDFHPIAS